MNIFVAYFLVAIFIAYILKHQLDVLELIPTKADIKKRNKINEKKDQLRLYVKLCPLWPILLIKEVYDEIQERRQS